MTLGGSDPESYITEYSSVYEDKLISFPLAGGWDSSRRRARSASWPPLPPPPPSPPPLPPLGQVREFVCKHLQFINLVSIKIATRLLSYYY